MGSVIEIKTVVFPAVLLIAPINVIKNSISVKMQHFGVVCHKVIKHLI